jgi:hypothetical protein
MATIPLSFFHLSSLSIWFYQDNAKITLSNGFECSFGVWINWYLHVGKLLSETFVITSIQTEQINYSLRVFTTHKLFFTHCIDIFFFSLLLELYYLYVDSLNFIIILLLHVLTLRLFFVYLLIFRFLFVFFMRSMLFTCWLFLFFDLFRCLFSSIFLWFMFFALLLWHFL